MQAFNPYLPGWEYTPDGEPHVFGDRTASDPDAVLLTWEEQKRLEDRLLPEDIDYLSIPLLRVEARQKLAAIRPRTLGQAGRISGVSPADIGGLIVWLSNNGEKHV